MDDKMIVAAHQPLFIPWIGYFDKMNKVDLFVIVDNVQFTSSGFIRRNMIRSLQSSQKVIVPVKKKKHLGQLIKDVEIDNEKHPQWKRKHLNAFKTNYSKAPYYGEIIPSLCAVYERPWDLLCDLNVELVNLVRHHMGIKTKIVKGSDIRINGKKTELIVDICRKTGAGAFMLGMGGSLTYADRNYIQSKGIKIVLQDFKHPVYPQFHGGFIPNLSIIDLLFNMGQKSIEIIRNSGSSENIGRT